VAWHVAGSGTPAPAPVPPPRIAAVTLPAAPPKTEQPLVRVRNPFDAFEVFEFPPETTMAEAREAMAQLLLQRARTRIAQGTAPAQANLSPRPRRIAQVQPEIFVTKLSGDAN
jgi:hypothetical protein